jgi:TPR repeat protein
MAVLDSNKINFRTKKGRKPLDTWSESTEHRANMSAYIDCLLRAAAAKPDYAKPQIEIAAAYLKGWGVEESRDEALRLLRAAASLATPDDLCEMSYQIEYEVAGSDPWPEGMREAETWYRRAAEQGYATGQFNLGEMYSKGEGGLQKNYELAKFWFGKAAEGGDFPPTEYALRAYWDEQQSKSK